MRLVSAALLTGILGCEDGAVDSAPGGSATLLACGGGAEGDEGDAAAWSTAYRAILDGGDVTGDGQVRVVILASGKENGWLPAYFEWLGADVAVNLPVPDPGTANASLLADADAVFIKGGDQGDYYDAWNDTGLEEGILRVAARGGGVGGTSAGAMALPGFAFAGGRDLTSTDVLTDSFTHYLDDRSDGGSGIHDDFLGLLPGVLVDTHFTQRARLGRLAGLLARGVADGQDFYGVGIDEQTCITVHSGVATVSGVGGVTLLHPASEAPLRGPGAPLVWSGLPLHRLVEGASFDVSTGAPSLLADDLPPFAPSTGFAGGDWTVAGLSRADEEGFAHVVSRAPDPYAVRDGTAELVMPSTLGFTNAHDDGERGPADEALYRALYDHPEAVAFTLGAGASLSRPDGEGGTIRLEATEGFSTMVIDASRATSRGLSASWSPFDVEHTLRPAGLTNLRLHVLYTGGADGRAFSLESRAAVMP